MWVVVMCELVMSGVDVQLLMFVYIVSHMYMQWM